MHGEIEELIKLQSIDKEIIVVKKKINEIPLKIKKVEEEIEKSKSIVKEAKEKLLENQKLRDRLELESKSIKDKIKEKKSALNMVKTNKEYSAILSEIEALENQYDEIENKLIEELYNAESIQEEIKNSEKKRDEITKNLTEEKNKLLAYKKELEEELEKLLKKREEIEKTVTPKYLDLYKNIAKDKEGVALSKVVDGFCSECYIKIRPQILVEIKKGKEIITCENCGRILYISEEE